MQIRIRESFWPWIRDGKVGSRIRNTVCDSRYKSMVVVILILPLDNIMSASTRTPAYQTETVVPCSCLSRFLDAERDSVNPLMSAICCIFCLRFSFSLARRSGRCSSHSWNQRGSYSTSRQKTLKIRWTKAIGYKCTSHASVRKLSRVSFKAVLRIRISRIRVFLGFLDPNPLAPKVRIRILLSSSKISKKNFQKVISKKTYNPDPYQNDMDPKHCYGSL